MQVHFEEILFAMINFVIAYFIFKHYFFDKVKNVIEERNNIIKMNIDKAIADREEAEIMLNEAKIEKDHAKEEGISLISAHKSQAELLYDEILNEAHDEAKIIAERGRIDAQRERDQAKKDIRANVLELSTLLSKKAIGEDAKEETHRRLIDEVISKVGEL